PMARVDGSMQMLEEGAKVLTHEDLFPIFMEVTPEKNREEFDKVNDTDFAHTIEGLSRFRANLFMDRRGIGGVFRQIPFDILSVEQIGLPQKVLDLCWLSKGLVLVTGPTGSGKSTTLATLIDYINQNREDHIITIEDPIEFVHPNKKCLVNQREIGTHTKSFKSALRAALREDPDIVLVGEMRDLETISIAVETAETGHLVFGTLHTTSAPSTVDRIIDQFPPDQQEQIRVMLSESLRGVVAQVLCKKKGGGRAAAYEIMVANSAVANLIREGKTFQLKSVMQTGRRLGMQTMNDHLLEHVKAGRVAPEEAYIKSNDKALLKQAFTANGIKMDLVED
ncbi:MAG: type IV pilus twitching motility protein PilT, partial [Polyangiales bacterium]